MAKMQVYETGDMFKDLFDFDVGMYAQDVLDEAASILEPKLRENAQAVVKHTGESDMVNSIKANKAKKCKNGAYIVNIGPRGYSNHTYTAKNGKGQRTNRKYKVSNALKAIWIEYGVHNVKSGQDIPARPFISRTVSQLENQIHNLMQKRFEEKAKI